MQGWGKVHCVKNCVQVDQQFKMFFNSQLQQTYGIYYLQSVTSITRFRESREIYEHKEKGQNQH